MECNFADRLVINYIPSQEETAFIQSDLAAKSQELALLENSMILRIRELCQLSAQRVRLRDYIHSHAALITTPRRLPEDIIREIFVACLPGAAPQMSPREAPLLLCRICSGWRKIALATPALWASLEVSLPFLLVREPVVAPALVQWLRRSGTCPLSLKVSDLYQGRRIAGVDTSQYGAILEHLRPFTDRWSHLEVDRYAVAMGIADMRITAPMLSSIYFTGAFASFKEFVRSLTAPNLRAVTFCPEHTRQVDDLVLDIPLPWGQLTHLDFSRDGGAQGISLLTVLQIFRRCTRLVSIHLQSMPTSGGLPAELVTMRFLETFVITIPYILQPQAIRDFLDQVSMPSLRRFDVATSMSRTLESCRFLMGLGTNSPGLLEVRLHLRTLTRRTFVETLRGLPSLVKLTVSGDHFCEFQEEEDDDGADLHPTDFILAALTTNDTTILCPALRELQVINRDVSATVPKARLLTFFRACVDMRGSFRRLQIGLFRENARDVPQEEEIRPFFVPSWE
ncbi:hypothetical protein FB45DRAFT_820959, partial [Roridomyces roridus]